MKKRQLLATSTLALAVLSSSALANFAVYDDTNHLYTGVSLDVYHFGTPDLGVGSTSNSNDTVLTNISTSGNALMPSLTVGYHFNNDFLSGLFGTKANIELNGSFASYSSAESKANLGTGYYRLINGSAGYLDTSTADMTNFHAKTNSAYHQINVMFRGDHESQTQMVTQHPEFGFVYGQLTQDTDYGMQWLTNPGINASTYKNNVSEDISTNYAGLAVGDAMKVQVSRHFFTNLGAQLQLLHASASLSGSQTETATTPAGDLPSNTAKASDSLSSVTYRGILTAGVDYAFTIKPDSPSIGVDVGYDRLGFTPTVENPTGSNNKGAHLEAKASNNFFAGVNVHLPL